jgi:N-acetylated-alpha-linked acidic dipeptidase
MSDVVRRMLDDVQGDFPWELVETFAKFPRWEPEDVNKSCDMMVERLKKHGVEVTVHECDLHLSIPYEASVELDGAKFRAKPPAYGVSTPDGIEGEVVYIPGKVSKSVSTLMQNNRTQAITPELVRGKIVVSEGFAFPAKMHELEAAGCVGIIAVNPGIDIHWGICTSIWGTPDLDDLPRKPKIAVAAVNNPDGQKIIAAAGTGKKVKIRTRLKEGWFKQKLPVVEIKGAVEPEKFVLLHGHYDSWDVGVGDNATGNATLLEAARVLWKHRHKLRRSVRIAWWPGHSTGRYAGSTWFADKFAIDLDENCVMQVNCDSPGCRWASIFKDISWMSEAESFAKQVIKEVTGQDSHGERPHRAGDYAFNNIGISSAFMLSSTMPDDLREEKGYYAVGGCGANIAWHTENDTLEIADKDNMVRDIKVYLATVAGAADAEVLPLDWRATAKEFQGTIDKYQKAAGNHFDLGPAKRAAESLSKTLNEFYQAVEARKVKPEKANQVIADLARVLVPINFTREARFRHDPATPVPPLPTLSTSNELSSMPSARMGFALTQLTRGQNRVIAAFHDAERKVAAVL